WEMSRSLSSSSFSRARRPFSRPTRESRSSASEVRSCSARRRSSSIRVACSWRDVSRSLNSASRDFRLSSSFFSASSTSRIDDSAIAAASGIRSTSRASQASTVKGTWEQLPSRFEDRAEDGESALADLDRVLLHRVVGGPHLLHLQVANELAAGMVESEQHDPVDEEPLVPQELAVAFRIPFHHDERREFVVAEHL